MTKKEFKSLKEGDTVTVLQTEVCQLNYQTYVTATISNIDFKKMEIKTGFGVRELNGIDNKGNAHIL